MALDSFLFFWSSGYVLVVLFDRDRFNDAFGLWTHKIDRQQSVLQVRAQYFHAVRQYEGTLELTRGDAAMDVLPGLVVRLAPADHQLAFLHADVKLVAGKPCYR